MDARLATDSLPPPVTKPPFRYSHKRFMASRPVENYHAEEPFGVELYPTDSTTNTIKFTGQEEDACTGNLNLNFRFYQDAIGRFLKPDNIAGNAANPQSWNRYAYVNGSPVNMNDPTGHTGFWQTVKNLFKALAAVFTEDIPEIAGDAGKAVGEAAMESVSPSADTNPTAEAGKAQYEGAAEMGLCTENVHSGKDLAGRFKEDSKEIVGEGLGQGAKIGVPLLYGAGMTRAFTAVGELGAIWGDSKLFTSWLKGSQSLSRISSPLNHTEARQVIDNARRLGIKVDTNPVGLAGLEKTGKWADVPHFKVGNVHIPVEPGYKP